MAEGEERLHLLLHVRPTVAHKDAFVVLDIHRVLRAFTRIFAQLVCGYVLQTDGEREGQLATGIDIAHQDGSQRMSGLRTEIPVLHDGRHLLHPRHGHSVAGDVHHDESRVGGSQGFNHPVLTVRQAQGSAVGILAILSGTLVQAPDEDDIISILGLSHSLGNQFFGSTVVLQVLAGHHTVVFAAGVAHIAADIHYLGFIAHTLADALQGRHLALHLQRRASAAHCHHLDRILADHDNLLGTLQVDGQKVAGVLQQHDAFLTDAAGSGIVLGRTHGAKGLAGIHAGAKHQAQHAAHLVIQFLGADLALLDELQIRLGQVIVVVSVAGTAAQAVGPAAELQVYAMGNGLLGVVHAAPIGHDGAVEAPFAAQDVVQQAFVLPAMAILIEVVAAHDGPRLALLHGGLEGGQVDFIQGTVVHDDIRVVAVHFVVVQGKVLHADSHAVLLHALDIGHDHAARQIGVFAHILEIAAVQRSAVDVDTGTQQHVLLAIAGLLAHALTVEQGHLGIPRGGQTGQGRESHARVIGPAGLIPFVPQHFGADAVRAVVGPQLRDAQTCHARTAEFGLGVDDGNLFLQRHAPQRVFHSFLDRFVLVQIDGLLLGGEGESRSQSQGKQKFLLHNID